MEIKVGKKKKATIVVENDDGSESSYEIRKPLVEEQDDFGIAYDKAVKSGNKEVQAKLTRDYITNLGMPNDVIKSLDVGQADVIYEGITGFLKKK